MNIIINEIERPKCNSFTMFAEPNLVLLAETKEIEVHVHNHTKTKDYRKEADNIQRFI